MSDTGAFPDRTAPAQSPAPPRRWLAAVVPAEASLLELEGLKPIEARMLARRGVTNREEAESYLNPTVAQLHSGDHLPGVLAAASRLLGALAAGEKVCVVGDYDVDGVSSLALLSATFDAIGLTNKTIVPHRFRDGYGVQTAHIDEAAEWGAGVLVTVDCGITAHAPIDRARSRGMDVIVVDHHLPSRPEPMPAIVINPHVNAGTYPETELCGAGLALKLAIAVFEAAGREPPLDALLRIACLGTIADMVPLRGENRVIASLGLRALASVRSPGLRALMSLCSVRAPVRADDVGFRIGPRLNAAGRLDSAEHALELLLTRDQRRGEELALLLDSLNRERQAEEQRVVQEARKIFSSLPILPAMLVAARAEWHRGVVGIAASRLAREFHRPAVLLAEEGEWCIGSGRSVPGVHLFDFLSQWKSDLERFGGHGAAIGLTVATAALPTLQSLWLEKASSTWAAEVFSATMEYEFALHSVAPLQQGLYELVARFEPFGSGNQQPMIRFGGLTPVQEARTFGNGHLQVLARDSQGNRAKLVHWQGSRCREAYLGEFEVMATLVWDDYLGAPALSVVDVRPSSG